MIKEEDTDIFNAKHTIPPKFYPTFVVVNKDHQRVIKCEKEEDANLRNATIRPSSLRRPTPTVTKPKMMILDK